MPSESVVVHDMFVRSFEAMKRRVLRAIRDAPADPRRAALDAVGLRASDLHTPAATDRADDAAF